MSALRGGCLFAGAGALELAVGSVLDVDPVWFVENDPAASLVLAHHWPGVPNYGDITTVDWDSVEPIDLLTGGFPCVDVSSAGKRAGLRPGTRSGLWSHMAYAINKLRPKLVVIENVRGLLSTAAACDLEPCPWCLGDNEDSPLRACGAVLGDLASLGYVGRWHGLRASDVGAPHERFRVFITAWPKPATDSSGDGRGERWPEPTRVEWGFDAAQRGDAVTPDTDGIGQVRCGGAWRGRAGSQDRSESPHSQRSWVSVDGTDYGPAIHRWETILGRPAPNPTVTGQRGGQQLSPYFTEWMQGWPDGWVTAVPGLSRNNMIRLAGNGVVPRQAAAAVTALLSGGL